MTLENYRKIYIEYLKDKGLVPDDEYLTDEEIRLFVKQTIVLEDFEKYKDVILDK